MAETTFETDEQLVSRAGEGDDEALAALLERHVHPAWRIALAASATPAAAEQAVVTGFCDAVNAADRHPDPTLSLRTRIAAAVHAAALAADRPEDRCAPAGADPVVAAFATLPPASRTALWLTEVEGGDPGQAAPVLGVAPGVATAMVTRARAALRSRMAADADGTLTGAVHLEVRPALRRIVTPVPETLPAAVAERWSETGGRDRPPTARRWNQRLVGAAAAAVVAAGLAGVLLFGGGGGDDRGPRLSAPSGTVDLSELVEEPTPTTAPLAAPALPPGTPVLRPAGAAPRPQSTPAAADRARSNPPATTATTAPAPPPPPAPTTTTTAPPPSTTTTTVPPGNGVGSADSGGGDPGPGLPSGPADAGAPVINIPGLGPISILP